ncbi:MAG: tRNA uridine-5-carboxymethylaminomethyl(34) synthesis GTPase MnmE [Paramuribaculum sp.]|nr:tRNA uridine-5-carboxymethylaminomethyl(34) synthesis GTPase MnmE [Paramuribaculum sp.]
MMNNDNNRQPTKHLDSDTICAVATPAGIGGIAVVRVCGSQAVKITSSIWRGRPLEQCLTHTAHLGRVVDPVTGQTVDQAVCTIFRGPGSYTGDDTVELSVHGSRYVQSELLRLLIDAGCRLADPGEYTRRAFAAGHLDLAEAEAVADLIAASSRNAHRIALNQMRGRLSEALADLRARLIDLASLVELELDFSEEDVSFASRTELRRITDEVIAILERLTASFGTAQAIRDGIPLAIVGAPNAGKSTLLNTLADDDRAIVSPIAGTTRDTIEDTIEIEGTTFRVIDTAGLRENPTDEIEAIGIDRSLKAISRATVVVWVVDPTATDSIARTGEAIINALANGSRLIIAVNKADIFTDAKSTELSAALHAAQEAAKGVCDVESAMICATTREGSEPLRKLLGSIISAESLDTPMLTNARHYQAASAALTSLRAVASALGHPNALTSSSIHPTASPHPAANGTTTATDAMISADSQTTSDTMDKALPPTVDVMTHTAGQSETGPLSTMKQSAVGDYLSEYPEVSGSGNESESESSLSLDLVAIDLRAALHHLGEITGAITTPDLLATIFSRFCIGK